MRLICPLIAALLCLAGCVGTEVGNPQDSEVRVEFAGYERAPENALTLASGIEVDEAWLVFDQLRLREAADCTGGDEIDVDRGFAAELISGREYPSLDALTRPATEYCRLELRLADVDQDELPDEVPDELEGLSVLVRGTHADGRPFELRAGFSDDFRLNGRFTLSGGSESLLVAFALNEWFDPDQLDAADGQQHIAIDGNNNNEILDAFRAGVRRSARLFRDANEDGQLQPNEHEEPLAEGVADDEEADDELASGD